MRHTSRQASALSESLHYQLNMYTLAATAAGVGALALAQPAEASIIYTRTHHVIRENTHFNLDLNHDGKTDFVLGNSAFCTDSICVGDLWVGATPIGGHRPGNSAMGYGTARYQFASALKGD